MEAAWRKYLDMASGITDVTRRKAEDIVKMLVARGEVAANASEKLVEDLLGQVESNRKALQGLVGQEVERVLKGMDLVRKSALDATEGRITILERLRGGDDDDRATNEPTAAKTAVKKAPAKKAPAKKATSKKATSRKTAAKATAKKATAKKSGTKKSTAKKAAVTAPAKKATSRKTAAKATAKKATAKKATAKKATSKKATAKKATSKKASTKKATSQKTAAKATAKKAVAKAAPTTSRDAATSQITSSVSDPPAATGPTPATDA